MLQKLFSSNSKWLALALPLLLAGCGGPAAPVDPCKEIQGKVKGVDIETAQDNAKKFVDRRTKLLKKKFPDGLKIVATSKECKKPDPPKEGAKAPLVKPKPSCIVKINYCVTPKPVSKAVAPAKKS